jgi:hypothetical protein
MILRHNVETECLAPERPTRSETFASFDELTRQTIRVRCADEPQCSGETIERVVVGGLGTGTLTVQNGGTVNSSGASVGLAFGSTGAVTVTGPGSRRNNTALAAGHELLGRRPAKVVAVALANKKARRLGGAGQRRDLSGTDTLKQPRDHSGGLKGWHWEYKVTSRAYRNVEGDDGLMRMRKAIEPSSRKRPMKDSAKAF